MKDHDIIKTTVDINNSKDVGGNDTQMNKLKEEIQTKLQDENVDIQSAKNQLNKKIEESKRGENPTDGNSGSSRARAPFNLWTMIGEFAKIFD
jgi:hypothetical protein